MKKLLVPFCLTLIIFIGSAGVGWSASLKKDLYAERRGDCATFLREFIPLAEQKIVTPQAILGLMYREGQGLPQDYKTAVKWLKLAAEPGDAYPESQGNLAFRYEDGWGVKKDLVYAYMWHSISKTNGLVEPGDMGMLMLEFKMTPSQIERAQDLAPECVSRNYKDC